MLLTPRVRAASVNVRVVRLARVASNKGSFRRWRSMYTLLQAHISGRRIPNGKQDLSDASKLVSVASRVIHRPALW
jgi:hypothetical protein